MDKRGNKRKPEKETGIVLAFILSIEIFAYVYVYMRVLPVNLLLIALNFFLISTGTSNILYSFTIFFRAYVIYRVRSRNSVTCTVYIICM